MLAQHSEEISADIAEKALWVSLNSIYGLGSHAFIQLLKAFGSPAAIYEASLSQLKDVVPEKLAIEIRQGVNEQVVNNTVAWLAKDNNHVVTLADPAYPRSLLEITDPPALLYAKGDIALLNMPGIAMVGSRNASVQGEKNAEAFAADLSQQGLCINSGMALGIDGAAHRGALKANGKTIAVVGTGLDIVYPAKHRDLAHQIVEHGLIISEFALGTPSKPQNFPKRNRIISGLSLGCLVVEANLQSGSQITARLAAEQGREVFAIPGSIHSPMSKGCHQLIKQGAKLVDCIQDILDELDIEKNIQSLPIVHKSEESFKNNSLLDFMGFEAISLENIVGQSGLTVSEVSSMLMLLELEGSVSSLPGGKYQRLI